MYYFFNAIHTITDPWWTFLFSTNIPRTNITFGGLFVSLFLISVFCFLVRMAFNRKGEE